MPEFVIMKSLPKVLMLTVLAILMTLACLWAGFATPGFVEIVGWFGVVFFGAGILIIPLVYFRKHQLLVLENAGFREYSTYASIGDWGLAWEQVAQIRPGNSRTKYTLICTIPIFTSPISLFVPRMFSAINRKWESAISRFLCSSPRCPVT